MTTTNSETTITCFTNAFLDRRGKRICSYYWKPSTQPRALVHISHGYTEHSMVYDKLAKELAKRRFFVFAHDHEGHGHSVGARAYITSCRHISDTVQLHIDIMKKKYPELPMFLFGHSLGAALGCLLALDNPKMFKGVILMSPTIEPNPETSTFFKLTLVRTTAWILPWLPISYVDYSLCCRDIDRVNAMNRDPLRYHGYIKAITVNSIWNVITEMQNRKEDMKVPYLVLQGDEDKVCHVSGAESFYKRSSSQDKTLKIYQGAYHSLHTEPDGIAEDCFNRIVKWLEERG